MKIIQRFNFVLRLLPKNKARNIVRQKDNQNRTILRYLILSKNNLDVNKYTLLINSGAKATQQDINIFNRKAKKGPKYNQIIKMLKQAK